MVSHDRLVPMIQTAYRRAAFQLPTSNDVRISLDTGMELSDEYLGPDNSGDWGSSSRGVRERRGERKAAGAHQFPFAVLEIKLARGSDPAWVSALLQTCHCIPVWKFSKFQHAMALLHRDKIFVQPHWVTPWVKTFGTLAGGGGSRRSDRRNDKTAGAGRRRGWSCTGAGSGRQDAISGGGQRWTGVLSPRGPRGRGASPTGFGRAWRDAAVSVDGPGWADDEDEVEPLFRSRHMESSSDVSSEEDRMSSLS